MEFTLSTPAPSLSLTIVAGKARHSLSVSPSASVGSVMTSISSLTGVAVPFMKLFVNKQPEVLTALKHSDITVGDVIVTSSSSSSSTSTSTSSTSASSATIRVVGSSAAAVAQVQKQAEEAKAHGPIRNDLGSNTETQFSRRLVKKDRASPYRFESIEALPGYADTGVATDYLEQLATDPGIVAILEKHKWRVGCFKEMLPKGLVGVSASCLMGLNKNKGEEIILRLRTDDMMGWRKYGSVREVLCHELAHNVFSDHDNDFKALNSQLLKEVVELDWTASHGRRLGGKSSAPPRNGGGGNGGGVGGREGPKLLYQATGGTYTLGSSDAWLDASVGSPSVTPAVAPALAAPAAESATIEVGEVRAEKDAVDDISETKTMQSGPGYRGHRGHESTDNEAVETVDIIMHGDGAHPDLTIAAATAEDCAFIARATLYAERAHLDVGIWDLFFEDEDDETKLRCLASCAETAEQSHLHWRHFLVARSAEDGKPVGSCSRYMAPVSADATYLALKEVTRQLLGWSDDQHLAACGRLSFLTDSANWPDLPIYEGSCFLETVFTESSCRGRGVASVLLDKCMRDGDRMGASRCFLLAAIGNNGALRVYNRSGLKQVAQLLHADCQSSLGLPGFDIMVMEYTTVPVPAVTCGCGDESHAAEVAGAVGAAADATTDTMNAMDVTTAAVEDSAVSDDVLINDPASTIDAAAVDECGNTTAVEGGTEQADAAVAHVHDETGTPANTHGGFAVDAEAKETEGAAVVAVAAVAEVSTEVNQGSEVTQKTSVEADRSQAEGTQSAVEKRIADVRAEAARVLAEGEGRGAIETIILCLSNVLERPQDDRVKSLRMSNKTFQRRIARCGHAVDLLKACGWVDKDGDGAFIVWRRNDPGLVWMCRDVLSQELEAAGASLCAAGAAGAAGSV